MIFFGQIHRARPFETMRGAFTFVVPWRSMDFTYTHKILLLATFTFNLIHCLHALYAQSFTCSCLVTAADIELAIVFSRSKHGFVKFVAIQQSNTPKVLNKFACNYAKKIYTRNDIF
jgi:hypothetical protein